jgi:phospholipid transport system substrate-binding protein
MGVLFGFALLVASHQAQAASPIEDLKTHVTQVLQLLRDPALGGRPAGPERRAAVREVIDQVLDFPTMAERALGRHWSVRSAAEREEFVRVFSDLLEATYLGELERHADDSITYLKESVDGEEATVETKIVSGKSDNRVVYRMHQRDGRWLVYDVLVGGLSVVDNLRSQLNRILRDSSYADLIAKLRETGAGQASR